MQRFAFCGVFATIILTGCANLSTEAKISNKAVVINPPSTAREEIVIEKAEPMLILLPNASTKSMSNLSMSNFGSNAVGLIRLNHNNQCLDVHGDDNKTLIAHHCHGKANQLFGVKADQTIQQQDKCLDVAGESKDDGASVILHQCHGKLNQKWYADGKQLRNQLTGKCLTVNQNNRVVMTTCQNQANQQFAF